MNKNFLLSLFLLFVGCILVGCLSSNCGVAGCEDWVRVKHDFKVVDSDDGQSVINVVATCVASDKRLGISDKNGEVKVRKWMKVLTAVGPIKCLNVEFSDPAGNYYSKIISFRETKKIQLMKIQSQTRSF